ncbi:energy-coupling factor transport system permease protein [Hydrogenispora ethanolica]|uniref:Energy-coupling factor transport system permease protein n=1 Tax=Hydrogenispora ethanolica TaxID=1082276 RepID=A0A4R1RRC0_HYDET|nr:energy-coupling factor transporter transmembrane component T [Hydrogenispora ethanolica]TCL68482.1 energy-coupling factor transport system permease protein [Hydrogenispora ethanolica]
MEFKSLYQPKDTFIHRLDPISKLFYIGAAIAVPLLLPSLEVALVCLAVSAGLLRGGRVFRKVLPLIGFSLVVLLSIIVIQGLFMAENRIPLFRVGPLIFYREGLTLAFGLCLRVVNILAAFAILVLTTKPSDLIESLVRKGLSPKIGYVLSSVLQIIPQMAGAMETVMDAQRSRGMETEGRLSTRLKAFIPLIGPVVMNSLINTKERAMALEVRGFNSRVPKTFLTEAPQTPCGTVIQWSLAGMVLLALIWRLIG